MNGSSELSNVRSSPASVPAGRWAYVRVRPADILATLVDTPESTGASERDARTPRALGDGSEPQGVAFCTVCPGRPRVRILLGERRQA